MLLVLPSFVESKEGEKKLSLDFKYTVTLCQRVFSDLCVFLDESIIHFSLKMISKHRLKTKEGCFYFVSSQPFSKTKAGKFCECRLSSDIPLVFSLMAADRDQFAVRGT